MLQSITNTKQVMMLTSSFHGLTGLAQQAIRDAITKYPHLEECLPTLASYPVAFSNLRIELQNNKPTSTAQRITCIRATKQEIALWTWNSTPDVPFVEGFSLQSVGVALQGHDAQNEGAIALKQDGTIEISNTASITLQKVGIDAHTIYNGLIATGSLEVRKAYDRFVKSLGVKATHLAGGCVIVENSERQRVEEYLDAIRMVGVKSQFISKFEVLLANNEQAIKDAIEHKAKSFIEELEEKMKSAMREATLKSESDTMIQLMDMLEQYGIGDGLIEACSKVNEKINNQIKVIQDKNNKKATQDNDQEITQNNAQDNPQDNPQEIAQEIAQDNAPKKRGRKPKNQGQEIAQEIAQDNPQDNPQGVAQDNPQDNPQGVAQEIAQDNAQGVAQGVAQEIAQDNAQGVAQVTQDNTQPEMKVFSWVQARLNDGRQTPYSVAANRFGDDLVDSAIELGIIDLVDGFLS